MGLNIGGRKQLSGLFDTDISNRRLELWIPFTDAIEIAINIKKQGANETGIINLTFDALKSNKELFAKINSEINSSLLSNGDFDWISNEPRQLAWIERKLIPIIPDYFITPPCFKISKRDSIISSIDRLNQSLLDKSVLLGVLSVDWNIHIKNNAISKWLKDKNEALACEHAWSCIVNSFDHQLLPPTPISTFENLLLFIDSANVSPEELSKLIGKIKNGWSQKRYREKNEGRKQCNLLLSKKSIDRLDKLSSKYDMSKSDVIEILLLMEEKEKVYIKKRLWVLGHAADDAISE